MMKLNAYEKDRSQKPKTKIGHEVGGRCTAAAPAQRGLRNIPKKKRMLLTPNPPPAGSLGRL